MVVPEALAASTPVISTFENGGSVELLRKKGFECGFVYSAKNKNQLLETLIKSSNISEKYYTEMAKNCKIIDEEYSLDCVIKNFKEICKDY